MLNTAPCQTGGVINAEKTDRRDRQKVKKPKKNQGSLGCAISLGLRFAVLLNSCFCSQRFSLSLSVSLVPGSSSGYLLSFDEIRAECLETSV